MFDFSDAQENVTIDDILKKISEFAIWKKYCSNFVEVDKPFKSELYFDTKPSCRIYISKDNNLCYKDFGDGSHYNCFTYIQAKYKCTFFEALHIIANDFKIKDIKIDIKPSIILSNDIINNPTKPRIKPRIEIVSQNYTSTDYDYWGKYSISLQMLEDEEIISCRYAYLIKGDNTTVFEYKRSNPIYAYKEYDYETDEFIGYKLYFPLANKKTGIRFLNNSSRKNIDGYNKLPKKGDLLIITKSRKDRIVLKNLGYYSISFSSETANLPIEIYTDFDNRFDRLGCLYDNAISDDEGVKSANKLRAQYDRVQLIFIPEDTGCKDISEYIHKYGEQAAKELLKRLINE